MRAHTAWLLAGATGPEPLSASSVALNIQAYACQYQRWACITSLSSSC
jgi:hypothetical protein